METVKKESEGWDVNSAVAVVSINDSPRNSKADPLDENCTRRKEMGAVSTDKVFNGQFASWGRGFCGCIFNDAPGSGTCTSCSLATTCEKEAWGWNAACGYLLLAMQRAARLACVLAFTPRPSARDWNAKSLENCGRSFYI